jgi:chloramphenicol-sensitive protein RarD
LERGNCGIDGIKGSPVKNKGAILAITAYTLWGVFPVYWKAVQTIPAYELVCHRIIWSLSFLLLIVLVKKDWRRIYSQYRIKKNILTVIITAILLAVNWLIYIWAVSADYLVEASLGYFINPLINVILGVIFLKEALRKWQWASIGIAACGVLFLTFMYGAFPWIGLSLALSFGFYGLLRKIAPLNSVQGMSIEMSILIVPALIFLIFLEISNQGALRHASLSLTGLVLLVGIITVIPLLLFTSAAKKITLTTLGIIQYITPSLQFMLGVFMFHEAFATERFIGFCIIWSALLLYTLESVHYYKKNVRLRLIRGE